MAEEMRSPALLAAVDIFSGTVGGLAQVAAGHPLDTVKVRLQMQSGGNAEFSGMLDCFRKTIAREGVRGLYKGAMSPVVGAMFHNGNVFFSYGQSLNIVARRGQDVGNLDISQYYCAGALAAVPITMVEVPVDLVKCKLQAQVGTEGRYRGSFHAAQMIFQQHGLRGVYQGTGATLARNVPCFGGYFAAFEATKKVLTPEGQMASLATCFVAGGAAGFGFWGLMYPFETIKTRMQVQDITNPTYRSSFHCWSVALKQEGLAGLFKGYVPCVARAVLVNAAIFTAVTAAKRSIVG